MLLYMIRALFVLVVAGMAVRIARTVGENQLANPYLVFVGLLVGAIVIMVTDIPTARSKTDSDDFRHLLWGSSSGVLLRRPWSRTRCSRRSTSTSVPFDSAATAFPGS